MQYGMLIVCVNCTARVVSDSQSPRNRTVARGGPIATRRQCCSSSEYCSTRSRKRTGKVSSGAVSLVGYVLV
jgi:hypothetical protein